MKGIILAGGKATRLYPITKGVCKQMLPVYDKPLIYYPLSSLMLAGIRDILIISTPKDTPRFIDLLGNGSDLGIRLSYSVQKEPRGIAESFIVGQEFIGRDNVCLILGDNIFYGDNLAKLLKESAFLRQGAVIFGYYVKDPQRYGVVEFDKEGNVVSIEEKPRKPQSFLVAMCLYYFPREKLGLLKEYMDTNMHVHDATGFYIDWLRKKETVYGYIFEEDWFDIGDHKFYNKAKKEFARK